MTKFINLKLDEYFNNKIIADESSSSRIKENIENFGMYDPPGYFFSDSLPASNEVIHINDVSYIFPDKSANKLDNITCEEQEILIPNVRCNAIHFLGASEFGDNYDEYRISFSDGNSCKYSVFMPDSCSALMKWEYSQDYNCVLKGVFSNFNTHWFYHHKTKLNIEQNVYINSITLPFNTNIHIIAITLEL